MRLAVEQLIELKCGAHVYRDKIILKDDHEHGVAARHEQKESKSMEVDLGSIKYPVPQHHKKKGHMKPVSLEDAF